MIYFGGHLDFLSDVTKALNEVAPKGPDSMYLQVELRDVHDDTLIGRWSDEFGSNDWYFDTDPRIISETGPTEE